MYRHEGDRFSADYKDSRSTGLTLVPIRCTTKQETMKYFKFNYTHAQYKITVILIRF